MIRIELAIPAAVAVIMAAAAMLATHRESIRTEFITACEKNAAADECQTLWWNSPEREHWTSKDIWACWAGNPRTCAEQAEAEARELKKTAQ